MSDWQLGIDFGTSFTAAAMLEADLRVAVLDVESDGAPRMPSAVYISEDGTIVVGGAAMRESVFHPERFEQTPKRLVGEEAVFLGDSPIEVHKLVSAVLRRVYAEATRRHGGSAPARVQLTHPVGWAGTRLDVLTRAADEAGIPRLTLLPEPVAAALRIAQQATEVGSRIAVYDFGGGTFDAAILRRTATGFEIAGPPMGRDPLGGEDVDQRVLGYLGELMTEQSPEQWAQLMDPPDITWRRSATELRANIRRAKEDLSQSTSCSLWVPGLERAVQLSRTELERLVAPVVDETVDVLGQAIEAASTSPGELAGIYLVGGSSRIPLVADTIWRRLEVRPAVQDDPKVVVAAGASSWTPHGPATAEPGTEDKEKREEKVPAPARGRWSSLGSLLEQPQRKRLLLPAAAVILVVILVIVLSGGSKPAKAARGSSTSTTQFSGAQLVSRSGLGAVVPAGIASSCTQIAPAGKKGYTQYSPGVTDAVQCQSSDANGPLEVNYIKFSNADQLDRAFETDMDVAGVSSDAGDCGDDSSFPAECPWGVAGGSSTTGQVAYYNLAATSSEPGAAFVEWTITSEKVLIDTLSPELSDTDLRNWWDDCGGVGGSAVAERCASGHD